MDEVDGVDVASQELQLLWLFSTTKNNMFFFHKKYALDAIEICL